MDETPTTAWRDDAREQYTQRRREHWDSVAQRGNRSAAGGGYHRRLRQVFRHLVPVGSRVLEVGCGSGDLLAALEPASGVGIDLAPAMVELARQRHADLDFAVADAHHLNLGDVPPFDYVILSDVVNDLWDVQEVLTAVRPCCHDGTRVIVNFYSRLWQWPLEAARALGLARPLLSQNWLTVADMTNLMTLAGFEVIRCSDEVLCPLHIPLLSPLCDRVLARIWPLHHLAITHVLVARPRPRPQHLPPPRVSVIVPARNEAGHIDQILQRVPQMGGGTELVFVEGNSTDGTYDVVRHAIEGRPDCYLYRQTGKGKGDAVRLGFEKARGDILMILDADLTVPPELLPRFYDALHSGQGEFINGVRLVYPMQDRAMRMLNLIGNKFFSLAFSWLLGQPIKDTLCGTKVLWRRHYQRIAAHRAYFGDFDPFGDFDLIFGAARLHLKIVDLPVRYRERQYGQTNIDRWRHGWLLLKMVFFALRRIKFV